MEGVRDGGLPDDRPYPLGASVPERALSPSATEPLGVSALSGNDPSRVTALLTALRKIENFGHSHGHGRGFTCANIAQAAVEQYFETQARSGK